MMSKWRKMNLKMDSSRRKKSTRRFGVGDKSCAQRDEKFKARPNVKGIREWGPQHGISSFPLAERTCLRSLLLLKQKKTYPTKGKCRESKA